MTLHLDQATTPARSVRTSPSPSTLKLAPVTPLIGAEVTGVDLRDPLHADTIVQLRAALLERKVLIFRDQPIDAEQ
jgi:taurine dioxygenase